MNPLSDLRSDPRRPQIVWWFRAGNRHRHDALFANDEVHAHAADFDEIAVVEANGASDGRAVHGRLLVAGAEIVAVVTLIDLRGHFWLEPAAKPNSGHGRVADDGEFVGEEIFFLIDLAA